jgi:hypothetical protein
LTEVLKQALLAKLPEGSIHVIAPGEDEDLLYDGIAEDYGTTVKPFLASLKDVRDPYKTIFLDDLEKEYGILKDPNLTEQQRREQLAALVYATRGTGSLDDLQDQLHAAGFTNLFVYDNSPAVDTNIFVKQRSDVVCASPPEAFCADPPEFFASAYDGGEYVVNGDIFEQSVAFESNCADPNEVFCASPPEYFCGDTLAVKDAIVYNPTTNFNLIFFVGGAVTRDPGTGEIINIETVPIPETQRLSLRRIILRVKPLQTWGALIVNFTEVVDIWQDTTDSDDIIQDSESDLDIIQDI